MKKIKRKRARQLRFETKISPLQQEGKAFLRKIQWKLHGERIITGWFTTQVRFQTALKASKSSWVCKRTGHLQTRLVLKPLTTVCTKVHCVPPRECALKHTETLLVLVQQLWLCKLHLRASQRPSSFRAVHEDIFRKRQFGVLYLQGTGIWIVPTDSSYNVPSRRFIFMIERIEK